MNPHELGMIPHERNTWCFRFGETKKPITMEHYKGIWENGAPVMDKINLPIGTTVKIVMVSRFGDVGITNRLDTDRNYGARVQLDDLENLRKNIK
jgi:hypothetical protein